MGFDYSQLSIGDTVEVSTQSDFSKPSIGVIANVMPDCVNVLYTAPDAGQLLLMFCWHVEDDRAKIPGKFEEAQRALGEDEINVPQTGLFRIGATQSFLNGLPGRMAALERLVHEMAERVAVAEERSRRAEKRTYSGAKRGRKKKEPEQVASDAGSGDMEDAEALAAT